MDVWKKVYSHPPYGDDSFLLCDSLGLPLKPNVLLPDMQNYSCQDLYYYYKNGGPFQYSLFDSLTKRCCDTSVSTTKPYECTKNIRNEVLDDANRFIPPTIDYEKVIVEFRMSFEILHDINIRESTAGSFVEIG